MPPKKEKITSESTLQHLRRKPDNYIGTNSTCTEPTFLVRDGSIVREEIEDYNEALIHIYKEVIDNAADNIAREWSSPQSYINITVTPEYVEVTNDGKPIPVVQEEVELPNEITKKKETHTMYRTQALFNFFRTGTNATNDENDSKIGTNGIGMKAVLGVSQYAKIHHGDPDSGQQLTIEYKNGMTKIGEPKVKAYSGKKSFTTIHYVPDWKWFGLEQFSQNHIGIMHAMAKGLAFNTGLKVTFNDEVIKIANIKALGEAFFGPRQSLLLKNDSGDEILVMEQSLEEMETHGIRHLSFVNKSFTRNGGIHVQHNATKIGKAMAEAYGKPLKPDDAKKFFIYVVNYTIKGDLKWSGQTKAALNATEKGKPLKKIDVEKKDMMKCKKWNVWTEIATFLEGKTNRDANKGVKGKREYIGALGKNGVDANFAGTKKSKDCTLFICEGQSAKTLIDAGSKYIGGSDYIGVLALQGKINNVMKMDRADQVDKKFLQLMRQMIGLKMGCKYMDPKECQQLRYGNKIVLCCDQDYDGFHISCICWAFFLQEHPGLIENGIVHFLETPVIRTKVGKETHRFFLREDFDEWLKDLPENKQNQAVKNCEWLKGLGSNDEDLGDCEYIFKENFFLGQLTFKKQKDKDLMEIFFGGDEGNPQKKREYMNATFYNDQWVHSPKKGTMPFSEYIEHKFTGCVNEQIHRAIPCLDGLKESFKDILWTALHYLKENNKTDSFSLDVAKHSSYSHGGKNLENTVAKLAGNIIGVNNITMFKGIGGFGNRYVASDDHHGAAAARYTRVSLQPIMRKIFMEDDDPILVYVKKEGCITSPEYYLPIIPWFLVNGCPSSPGNSVSTNCPPYNPEDLVAWVRNWISTSFEGAPTFSPVELIPWFRGFRGTVEKYNNGWLAKGILIKNDENTWTIDEIAAGAWGVKLQTILEKLADEKKIEKPRIMNENKNTIRAVIKTKTSFDVEKALKPVLEHRYPMTNITCIHEKAPVTTNNVEEHLDAYARLRYKGYQDRRKYKLEYFLKQLKLKEDKIKFIKLVLDGTINFKKIRDKKHLVEVLVQNGFTQDDQVAVKETAASDEEDNFDDSQWTHITGMTMISCTQKGIDKLENEKKKVEKQYEYYKNNKPWQIWLHDLEAFMEEYPKYLKDNPMNVADDKKKK